MLYVILLAAVIIFWLIAVDRPVLKVKFRQGEIVQFKGHFPPTFKHNVTEIAETSPFDGVLKVYRQRAGMKLIFSDGVPKKTQQRIRNVFPHQGFSSKARKASKGH